MPTNKIQKVATADLNAALQVTSGSSRPSVAGCVVDGTVNALYINPDGTINRIKDQRGEKVVASSVTAATATVSTACSPCIYNIATSTSCVVTLPAASNIGFEVTVHVSVAAAGGQLHAVSPASTDMILFPAGSTGVTDKDLQITQATEAVGNYVTLRADGTTTWYTIGSSGTFARQG
jgi:hypothetical protein